MPKSGWIVLLLVLSFAGYRWYSGRDATATELGWEPYTIELGRLKDSIPCDGTLEPQSKTEIKSRVAGEVITLLVEAGDRIEAGQVIAQLDTEELMQEVRQAEANLTASRANYQLASRGFSPSEKISRESQVAEATMRAEQAQAEYNRVQDLHAQGFASVQELESAQTTRDLAQEALRAAQSQQETLLAGGEPEDREVARAQVVRNEAILATAREELANATIRAPVAGMLLDVPIEVGTTVSSGLSANSGGTIVAVLGDMDTLLMEGTVDESDVGRVTAGMQCEIVTDAYPTLTFSGEVISIAPQASNEGNVSTFKVEIAVDTANPTSDDSRARKEFLGTFAGVKSGPGGRGGGRRLRGGMGGGGGAGKWKAAGSGNSGGDQMPGGSAAVDLPEEAKPEIVPVLRAGMTSTAEIIVSSYDEAPVIPLRYLQFDDEGQPYVLAWPEGAPLPTVPEEGEEPTEDPATEGIEPIKTLVEIGYTDGVSYAIAAGLEPGDVIVAETEYEVEASWGTFGIKTTKKKK